MYIVIGGGGQVGFYLTKELLDQNHEVLLLDKDARRVKQLSEELGASVARGDACEVRVLEEYGCDRAEVVIAVTGDDEDNLVICQIAKLRFKVKKTIARVNNPRNRRLFKKLGIDTTVSPTSSILSVIESQIPHHTLVHLAELNRAGLGLVEVMVPQDSTINGQTIRSLDLPMSVNIVLIIRGDEKITPQGDSVIRDDDHIFALTTNEGASALRAIILGESEESETEQLTEEV
ncbi:MAG TPA: NAD-binding protein [Ktedonobacterales bacterium]|nr:NAD-binding protein [Ktedonobacterales bacterium]